MNDSIWVKEWPNDALSVHDYPKEGAVEYVKRSRVGELLEVRPGVSMVVEHDGTVVIREGA